MIQFFSGLVVSFYVIASFMMPTDGARWRFYPKAFKDCGLNLTIHARDIEVVYSDHGRKWILKTNINVREDCTTDRFTFDVFNDAHPPIKILTWTIPDMCNVIPRDNKFVNPIYATGEFPRTCHHKKGMYSVSKMDTINVTGLAYGNSAAYRGTVHIRVGTFDKENKHTSCAEGYGNVKITTGIQ